MVAKGVVEVNPFAKYYLVSSSIAVWPFAHLEPLSDGHCWHDSF